MNKALLQKELIELLDKHGITITSLNLNHWELTKSISVSIQGRQEESKGDANER